MPSTVLHTPEISPSNAALSTSRRCKIARIEPRPPMAAPKFSVGVDADPMMVEQTIDKTLEEIIKERRKEAKGERWGGCGCGAACACGFYHFVPRPCCLLLYYKALGDTCNRRCQERLVLTADGGRRVPPWNIHANMRHSIRIPCGRVKEAYVFLLGRTLDN